MSIKTLRKRIALVAVSALGIGMLSVTSANAAAGAFSYDTSSTGIVVAPTTIDTADADLLGGTASTTMTAAGTLVLDVASGTTVVKVTGGTIEEATFGHSSGGINAAKNCAYVIESTMADVKFKPTAAGTSMKIYGYAVSVPRTTINCDATVGVDASIYVAMTVVAAGASGTFSAANSLISLDSDTDTSASNSDTPNADFVSYYADGYAILNYELNDALGLDMPSSTVVTATVVEGSCSVGTDEDGTLPFVSGEAPNDSIYIIGGDYSETCKVNLAVNGSVVATKSVKFSGPVASVVVHSLTTAITSSTSNQTGKGYFHVKDASGTKLGAVTVAVDTTKYGSVVSAITLANSGDTSSDNTSINGGSAAGAVDTSFGVTCTGVKGTQKGMRLKYTNSAGVVTYSNEFDVSCFGGLFSYTASLDAASYAPGSIATLTISAKDSAGNPVADGVDIDNGTSALTNVSVTCGGEADIVTAVAHTDTFLGGKKAYKFNLSNTEGSYNCVVSLGDFTVANTGNTAIAAVTVPFSIKSTSTSVTNAEVLAAIVKLIASINKQIRALQKSLKK